MKKPRFSKASMLSYLMRTQNRIQAQHQFDLSNGTAQLMPSSAQGVPPHVMMTISPKTLESLIKRAVAFGELNATRDTISDIAGDYV
jgi:hypothetical protein